MTTKTYLGLAEDHSGSMRSIAHVAMRDFNEQLGTIQASAQTQDIIATVATIGVGQRATVGLPIVNSNVNILKPYTSWEADAGGTPMIESVFVLIDALKKVPDYNDPNVSFLVMITTDGQETQQRHRGRELAKVIQDLQNTDRWTFVFRVPKGQGMRELAQLGMLVSGINVYEWETTAAGLTKSTEANKEAFTEYFTQRTTGMKRTSKFYANMEDISVEDAKKAMVDISSEVVFYPVASSDAGSLIRPFVENKINGAMARGAAFYQLCKTEPKVQANKRIAVRDKNSGTVFSGDAARQMLALPTYGTVRLAPDELGDWDVFIQSTSVNRKLDANTSLMYWAGVGKAFQEGPSAR
jgi:hypothetical protein